VTFVPGSVSCTVCIPPARVPARARSESFGSPRKERRFNSSSLPSSAPSGTLLASVLTTGELIRQKRERDWRLVSGIPTSWIGIGATAPFQQME